MSTPNLDSRYAKPSDVTAAISAQATTDAGQYAPKDSFTINFLKAGAATDGTTPNDTLFNTVLSQLPSGGVLYIPRNSSNNPYIFTTTHTIPAGVTVQFAPGVQAQVPSSSTVGLFILNSKSSLIGPTIDGAGTNKVTATNCIQLATSASDCQIINPVITNWKGFGIYGIANTRPLVDGGVITATSGGIRFSTGGTNGTGGVGDVISPTVRNVTATGCTSGTGIQYDGDWNSSSWPTSGYKVRYGTISGCTSTNNYYAGFFINSGFECTITACHANGNTDYGIGFEYCSDSVISNSTASSNATYGIAIERNGQYNIITGCTVRANTQQGIWVNYNSGGVSGDTAGSENQVIGCMARGNGSDGITVSGGIQRTIISDNDSIGNANAGLTINASSDSIVTGGRYSLNSLYGLYVVNSSNLTISGADISRNTGNGIYSSGSATNILVKSCSIYNNSSGGLRLLSTSCQYYSIIDNDFHDNTGYAIDNNNVAVNYIRITNNYFRNNSAGGVNLLQPNNTEISRNTFYGNTSNAGAAINATANSGFSPQNLVIRENTIRSFASGITTSVGANASAGGDVYVQDNIITGTTNSYVYASIGTIANLYFRAIVSGTPEGTYYGSIGSQVSRSDGSSSTTLYVKESGVNTNTGWIAK